MAVVSVVRPGFDQAVYAAEAVAAPGARGTVTVAASSTLSETPRARFGYGALAFVVGAFVVAYLGDQAGWLREPLKLAADVNAFALIYVAAQGIERLLEPFSYYILPVAGDQAAAKQKTDEIVTADSPQASMDAAKDAANKVAGVNRTQKERTIVFWCLASILGIVVSAWLGLQFVAIVLDAASRAAIPRWFDVGLTGLVIGGGTKALHGLVERIGKPADAATTS